VARILVTAPNELPWSVGRHLVRGLEASGHTVCLFDYRSARRVADELLARVDEFRPEVHLLYKGELLRPETIHAVRERGVYAIHWHCDVDEGLPPWLLGLARAHDAFFTQAYAMVARLQEAGVERSAWLSAGFEPTAHQVDTITEADRKRYGSQVAFTGRIVNHVIYAGRVDMIKRVLQEGIDIKWWGHHIPRKLRTFGLLFSGVRRAWGGEFAHHQGYAKIARLAKIMLGHDSYPQLEKTLSSRAYLACGCGGFYLARYVKGMEEIFELDREIVVFETLDEMVEKIRYYLTHDAERRRIAEAGRRRVLEHYTYQKRFEQMFHALRNWGELDIV